MMIQFSRHIVAFFSGFPGHLTSKNHLCGQLCGDEKEASSWTYFVISLCSLVTLLFSFDVNNTVDICMERMSGCPFLNTTLMQQFFCICFFSCFCLCQGSMSDSSNSNFRNLSGLVRYHLLWIEYKFSTPKTPYVAAVVLYVWKSVIHKNVNESKKIIFTLQSCSPTVRDQLNKARVTDSVSCSKRQKKY